MTEKVKMLRTEHYRDENGIWHHCRKGHEYDVPDFLADAWCGTSQPVAEKVRSAPVKKPQKKVENDGNE